MQNFRSLASKLRGEIEVMDRHTLVCKMAAACGAVVDAFLACGGLCIFQPKMHIYLISIFLCKCLIDFTKKTF